MEISKDQSALGLSALLRASAPIAAPVTTSQFASGSAAPASPGTAGPAPARVQFASLTHLTLLTAQEAAPGASDPTGPGEKATELPGAELSEGELGAWLGGDGETRALTADLESNETSDEVDRASVGEDAATLGAIKSLDGAVEVDGDQEGLELAADYTPP